MCKNIFHIERMNLGKNLDNRTQWLRFTAEKWEIQIVHECWGACSGFLNSWFSHASVKPQTIRLVLHKAFDPLIVIFGTAFLFPFTMMIFFLLHIFFWFGEDLFFPLKAHSKFTKGHDCCYLAGLPTPLGKAKAQSFPWLRYLQRRKKGQSKGLNIFTGTLGG